MPPKTSRRRASRSRRPRKPGRLSRRRPPLTRASSVFCPVGRRGRPIPAIGISRALVRVSALPVGPWRLCFWLAVLLAVLVGGMALFLPQLLNDPETASWPVVIVSLVWAVLLVYGIPCSFLECVVTSAAAGEVYYIRWSGNLLVTLALSGAKWLACFLAGPILFAGTAVVYWLKCGQPSWLDRVILTELGIISIGYWFFALLSVTDRGRLRDINPLAVIDLAHRLGWHGPVVVGLAALVLLAHGWALLTGVTTVHVATFWGLLELTAAWMSTVFWSTFFFRLLGVWCHRSRVVAEE